MQHKMCLLETTHVIQAVLDGRLDVEPVAPRKLGRDVQILAREAALADRLARLLFVPVRLRSILPRQAKRCQALRGTEY